MIRSALVIALLLTGCAHKPETAKPPAATFKFEPAAGGALIVLYRNTAGFMGGGAGLNATLTIDNKALGDLVQDRYSMVGVAPGEHMVNVMGVSGVSNVLVNIAAGEVKYIQVQTYPSLMGSLTEAGEAMKHLDNEGEPLTLGFKYSFQAAPAAKDPGTTNL